MVPKLAAKIFDLSRTRNCLLGRGVTQSGNKGARESRDTGMEIGCERTVQHSPE